MDRKTSSSIHREIEVAGRFVQELSARRNRRQESTGKKMNLLLRFMSIFLSNRKILEKEDFTVNDLSKLPEDLCMRGIGVKNLTYIDKILSNSSEKEKKRLESVTTVFGLWEDIIQHHLRKDQMINKILEFLYGCFLVCFFMYFLDFATQRLIKKQPLEALFYMFYYHIFFILSIIFYTWIINREAKLILKTRQILMKLISEKCFRFNLAIVDNLNNNIVYKKVYQDLGEYVKCQHNWMGTIPLTVLGLYFYCCILNGMPSEFTVLVLVFTFVLAMSFVSRMFFRNYSTQYRNITFEQRKLFYEFIHNFKGLTLKNLKPRYKAMAEKLMQKKLIVLQALHKYQGIELQLARVAYNFMLIYGPVLLYIQQILMGHEPKTQGREGGYQPNPGLSPNSSSGYSYTPPSGNGFTNASSNETTTGNSYGSESSKYSHPPQEVYSVEPYISYYYAFVVIGLYLDPSISRFVRQVTNYLDFQSCKSSLDAHFNAETDIDNHIILDVSLPKGHLLLKNCEAMALQLEKVDSLRNQIGFGIIQPAEDNIVIGESKLKDSFSEYSPIEYHRVFTGLNLEVALGKKVCIYDNENYGSIQGFVGTLTQENLLSAGEVRLNGSISYYNPKIMHFLVGRTIRDNIIFGEEFNIKRYDEILKYVGTQFANYHGQDLHQLAENAVNIRPEDIKAMLLGRFLYQESDIYIIGQKGKDQSLCIDPDELMTLFAGPLIKKTVIYVSRLPSLLKLSDMIVCFQSTHLNHVIDTSHYLEYLKQNNVADNINSPLDENGEQGKVQTLKKKLKNAVFMSNLSFEEEMIIYKRLQRERKEVEEMIKKDINIFKILMKGASMVQHRMEEGKVLDDQNIITSEEMINLFKDIVKKESVRKKLAIIITMQILALCVYLAVEFKIFRMSNELIQKPNSRSFEIDQVPLCCLGLFITYLFAELTSYFFDRSVRTVIKDLNVGIQESIMDSDIHTILNKRSHRILDKLTTNLMDLETVFPTLAKTILFKVTLSFYSLIVMSFCFSFIPVLILALVGILIAMTFKQVFPKYLQLSILRSFIEHKVDNLNFSFLDVVGSYRVANKMDKFVEKSSRLFNNFIRVTFVKDVHFKTGIIAWMQVLGVFTGMSCFVILYLCLANPKFNWIGGSRESILWAGLNIYRLMYGITTLPTQLLEAWDHGLNYLKICHFIEKQNRVHNERKTIKALDYNSPIVFKSVSVTKGLRPTLKKISFKLSPRRTIGIIGLDDCGRGIIFDLLTKVIERDKSDDSEIRIFGHHLEDIKESTLHGELFVIEKNPLLFEGTIRQNIDPYSRYSDSHIVEKLRVAGVGQTLSDVGEEKKINRFDDDRTYYKLKPDIFEINRVNDPQRKFHIPIHFVRGNHTRTFNTPKSKSNKSLKGSKKYSVLWDANNESRSQILSKKEPPREDVLFSSPDEGKFLRKLQEPRPLIVEPANPYLMREEQITPGRKSPDYQRKNMRPGILGLTRVQVNMEIEKGSKHLRTPKKNTYLQINPTPSQRSRIGSNISACSDDLTVEKIKGLNFRGSLEFTDKLDESPKGRKSPSRILKNGSCSNLGRNMKNDQSKLDRMSELSHISQNKSWNRFPCRDALNVTDFYESMIIGASDQIKNRNVDIHGEKILDSPEEPVSEDSDKEKPLDDLIPEAIIIALLDKVAGFEGKNFHLDTRRLVYFCRAILSQPKLLLINEDSLDFGKGVRSNLATLRAELPACTILVITKGNDHLLGYDRILFLDAGKLIEKGDPKDLFCDKRSFLHRYLKETDPANQIALSQLLGNIEEVSGVQRRSNQDLQPRSRSGSNTEEAVLGVSRFEAYTKNQPSKSHQVLKNRIVIPAEFMEKKQEEIWVLKHTYNGPKNKMEEGLNERNIHEHSEKGIMIPSSQKFKFLRPSELEYIEVIPCDFDSYKIPEVMADISPKRSLGVSGWDLRTIPEKSNDSEGEERFSRYRSSRFYNDPDRSKSLRVSKRTNQELNDL